MVAIFIDLKVAFDSADRVEKGNGKEKELGKG